MNPSIHAITISIALVGLLCNASAQDQVEQPRAVDALPRKKPHQTRAFELTEGEITEQALESILKNQNEATTLEKLQAAIPMESFEDAAKYLNRASIESLDGKIDFQKDKLLLFAWKGSESDNFYVSPLISRPPEAKFTYNPGQDEKLKTHVKIFALQKDAKWSVSSSEIIRFKCGNDEQGQIQLNFEGPPGVKLDMKLEINGQEVPLQPQAPKE